MSVNFSGSQLAAILPRESCFDGVNYGGIDYGLLMNSHLLDQISAVFFNFTNPLTDAKTKKSVFTKDLNTGCSARYLLTKTKDCKATPLVHFQELIDVCDYRKEMFGPLTIIKSYDIKPYKMTKERTITAREVILSQEGDAFQAISSEEQIHHRPGLTLHFSTSLKGVERMPVLCTVEQLREDVEVACQESKEFFSKDVPSEHEIIKRGLIVARLQENLFACKVQ